MTLGEIARKRLQLLAILAAALTLLAAFAISQPAFAQQEILPPPGDEQLSADLTEEEADAVAVARAGADSVPEGEEPAFDYYGPEMIKGQPENGALSFQEQFSPNGDYALWMHDAILLPLITVVSLFVLALLVWVIVRYNRRSNPVASKTSHNTLVEVVWTVVPVLILVVIAVPSITLLSRQYQTAPDDALTIKATGYQWYWGYTYADNGGFEVISNMMDEADALTQGLPPQLAVDNRMVVPVGEPIRIQTIGADVIHSFGIPSLWFKLDAVPGRLNEQMLVIEEPGIYYGQCMELCGARHGYMPIAIEARPRAEFEQWVLSQPGGTLGGEEEDDLTEVDVPLADPVSDAEGAPEAGPAPTEDTSPTT